MSVLREQLENVRRHLGARTAWLLPCTAGLLGLEAPIRCGGGAEPGPLAELFGDAMPVPGRTGGELAQRLATLCGERRRTGARRMMLRVALPEAAGAHLLLERGDLPTATAALALALDALAACLRAPPIAAETMEAIHFLARDGRLAALLDRNGAPVAISPLLRKVLGGDRAGRPFLLSEQRLAFFAQLRKRLPATGDTACEAEGFDLPGTLHLQPLGDGAYVLAVVQGEIANAAMLRSLSDGEVTPRELTCGLRLAEGMSYREIAEDLGVSPDTVKLHLRALYQKLGVDGRDGLVARVAGLAPPPPLVRAITRRA
ncbi:helix-turn-helix transcriptional regulator [Vulgatibacter sp.]|uniref:helix-turn-helix transcriptional regulator n=1 Tax=Vulgatibacter sp. TaxID=1971226 RepID=UPI003566C222